MEIRTAPTNFICYWTLLAISTSSATSSKASPSSESFVSTDSELSNSTSTSDDNYDYLLIVSLCCVGVIVALILVMLVVCCALHWHKKRKAHKRAKTNVPKSPVPVRSPMGETPKTPDSPVRLDHSPNLPDENHVAKGLSKHPKRRSKSKKSRKSRGLDPLCTAKIPTSAEELYNLFSDPIEFMVALGGDDEKGKNSGTIDEPSVR